MRLRSEMIYSLLLLSIVACVSCGSQISCSGNQCDVNPENCSYGSTIIQGKLVCNKGPGERCGGEQNIWGKCGNGLTCSCNHCKGCSVDKLRIGIIECEISPCMDL